MKNRTGMWQRIYFGIHPENLSGIPPENLADISYSTFFQISSKYWSMYFARNLSSISTSDNFKNLSTLAKKYLQKVIYYCFGNTYTGCWNTSRKCSRIFLSKFFPHDFSYFFLGIFQRVSRWIFLAIYFRFFFFKNYIWNSFRDSNKSAFWDSTGFYLKFLQKIFLGLFEIYLLGFLLKFLQNYVHLLLLRRYVHRLAQEYIQKIFQKCY